MKYFTDKELQCKGSGVVKLDPRFETALHHYRLLLNKPMTVNSCCRSVEYNKQIGGAPNSYHLFEADDGRNGTMAVDIKIKNDIDRAVMIKLALDLRWSVGVYKTFLHMDRRIDLGRPQICFYGK